MSGMNLVKDLRSDSQITKIGTVRLGRAGTLRTALFSGLFLVAVAGASCGGPKYHISDAVLADVSLAQKEPMLAAQGEVNQQQIETWQLERVYSQLAYTRPQS